MKSVLKCLKCGTTYPPEFATRWGRSEAADGLGPDPRCAAVIPNPYAARAEDPATRQLLVAEELCRGLLTAAEVADNAKTEDIREFGKDAVRDRQPGYWRQERKVERPA
jgi:hypothetical protein